MLAPEVWSFDPPASTLKVTQGTLDSCSDLNNLIISHPYNHLVSVVLPDTPQIPGDILEVLSSDNEYYMINNISVHELIEREFLEAFVRRGLITAVSYDSHIDLDNSLALTPSGHLVLSLNKESYQELGLEGKPALSKSKDHQKYFVTVDLKAGYFVPGKKNYDRTHYALKNCLQNFNIILSWDPPNESVCPSSLASYFCGRGLVVDICKPKFKQRRSFNVEVPKLHPTEQECELQEMMEWLGSFSLEIESEVSPKNEFLSTYECPESTIECGQVSYLCWEGFFTSTKIMQLLQSLSNYFHDREGIPWVSMYVQGFSDVPVAWNLKPHVFYSDGDNSYTVILRPINAFTSISMYSNNKMIK